MKKLKRMYVIMLEKKIKLTSSDESDKHTSSNVIEIKNDKPQHDSS